MTGSQLFELLQGWSPECFEPVFLPHWQPGNQGRAALSPGRWETICQREGEISYSHFLYFAILAMGNEHGNPDSRLAILLAGGLQYRMDGANREGIAVGELVQSRAID